MGSMDSVFCKVTDEIKVSVAPAYVENQSGGEGQEYVWMYTVQLENNGARTVQLLNRHWKITDAFGRIQEVNGPGVIGEQPVLKPGESFSYTSGTALPTPSGIMMGSYEMEDEAGGRFEVEIPAFSLDSPEQLSRAN